MIDYIDHYFLSKSDPETRLQDLRTILHNYGFHGDYRTMLRCYNDWKRSNYTVWPFPGGRLQQPVWVTTDFDTLEAIEEMLELDSQRPSVDGLPTIDDLLG